MKIFILLFSVCLIICISDRAYAAELIMVEQSGCGWCKVWHKDIGAIYQKTSEGKIAPLRRVDIHHSLPDDLKFITGLVYTPTFVLIENKREVGRIRGYPGQDYFWGMLQKLLLKLPNEPKSTRF